MSPNVKHTMLQYSLQKLVGDTVRLYHNGPKFKANALRFYTSQGKISTVYLSNKFCKNCTLNLKVKFTRMSNP